MTSSENTEPTDIEPVEPVEEETQPIPEATVPASAPEEPTAEEESPASGDSGWAAPIAAEKKESTPLTPEARQKKDISIARFFLTMMIVFLLSYTFLGYLNRGLSSTQSQDPYATVCPEEGKALASAVDSTKLHATPFPDIYLMGSDKASTELYIKAGVGCELEYAVFPTTVDSGQAQAALKEAGWSVTTDGTGVFQAEKKIENITYALTYPQSESEEKDMVLRLQYS